MSSTQQLPNAPPPEYTVGEEGASSSGGNVNPSSVGPLQVLIVPTQHATDFESGALGVEGEHASVEGEVQIKGAVPGAWQTMSITFQSIEASPTQSVELASTTQTLYSSTLPQESSSSGSIPELPSVLPFSIPLAPDTPECIHTPTSSLSHYLIVKLSPTELSAEPFETKIRIHLRRYSTPTSPFLPVLPYSATMESPSPVIIQLPRLEFRMGEPIPVYITVPPPNRQHISESGLRLRNAKAELIRIVSLNDSSPPESGRNTPISAIHNPLGEGSSTSYSPFFNDKKSARLLDSRLGTSLASHDGTMHSAVMSRSGAACRFHSSRPVQLRLVLHPFSLSAEVTASGQQSLASVHEEREADGCASITQTTPLHTTAFYLLVRIGFISTVDRMDVTVEQSIPITMIPGLAPVEQDVTAVQYSKKHDPPPERTYRYDGGDIDPLAAPPFTAYDTQSGMAGLATPDASEPPPFFSEPGGSHPPSFVEAENHIASSSSVRLAEWSATDPLDVTAILRIPGEGEQFGFAYENIYDGFGDGTRTPPPPLAASEQGGRIERQHLVELLGEAARLQALALSRTTAGEAPPPPPAMDDPMDPPPAIDDAFRLVPPHPEQDVSIHPSAETPPPSVSSLQPPTGASGHGAVSASEGGPPPYLSPPTGQQQAEHTEAPGPPPYEDFAGAPPAA